MNIEKLPKWAQEIIRDLTRQRETAIRALNEYIDNQTPSPIYVEEMECTGEGIGPSYKKRYIQSRKISVSHSGVDLVILLRDDYIDLQWGSEKLNRDAAFIPSSYQSARLVSKENMR
jgi:hypothetical protein